MNYDLKAFREGIKNLKINLSDKQIQQFLDYYETLTEWNKVMNLTTITDFQDVVQKHFLDSLALAEYADLSVDKKIIDVGTGAGFPGIPLAIAFPNLSITLMDSLQKRINFLSEVKTKLELRNIEIIHARAEDLGQDPGYREQYDIAVSRAVANLAVLSEYCLPFVKKNGTFVAFKSNKAKEEIEQAEKAIQILGGKLERIDEFKLPGSELQRALIFIRKTSVCPKKYPRKAGTPSKKPLA